MLVLIRHTACAVEAGICYGRLDLPLAAGASEDIARTLTNTPGLEFVFTSPAQRCRQLAEALMARDGCSGRALEALQELDFGDWEGRSWSAIHRVESDAWAADPWNQAPPNGETEMQLWHRVGQAAKEIRAHPGRCVGVVAHAGPLRLLRCLLLGLPLSERWAWTSTLGGVELIP
jgi:alpha-ribazole phosphatase